VHSWELHEDEDGEAMNLNGALNDEGVYYFVTPEGTGRISVAVTHAYVALTIFPFDKDLLKAVDLKVIKQWTDVCFSPQTLGVSSAMHCLSVISVVRGQELMQNMERDNVSFLTRGALGYVRNFHCAGLISDYVHLL